MLYHLVIIAAYAMTSLVIGRQLPAFIPNLDPMTGYWVGGCFFLGCALLHEFVMRRVERVELQKEIRNIRRDLSTAESGLERFEGILGGIAGEDESLDGFADDMKILRKLLNQLSQEMKKGPVSKIPEGVAPEKPKAKANTRPHLVAVPKEADHVEDPERDEVRKSEILEIVRSGLQENRVDLYLQPIVRLPQRRAKFYEAFSRIRGPEGEIITPRQYLSIAEEAGLVGTIDNLLLIRCVQLIRRVRQRNNEVGFFVNVSARTMRDSNFFHQFVEFLDRNSDLTENLILEFAQEDIDNATEQVKTGLKMLSDMGFVFSMDQVVRLDMDFNQLAKDNFKYLKVSASDLLPGGFGLPMNIHPEDLHEALARAEVELIASQVEDEDTVIGLLDADVSFGQGYLFGVPKPPQTTN
ncbi:EAL domain-containing protein [Sneathiella limimaris]|uniref:EAL domain-containing protein n=1 Tax=Sneathiella limimaris TaxID=1964213 RepID=UPI00146F4C2B